MARDKCEFFVLLRVSAQRKYINWPANKDREDHFPIDSDDGWLQVLRNVVEGEGKM